MRRAPLLVTGAGGRIGRSLLAAATPGTVGVVGPHTTGGGRSLDVADARAVRDTVAELRPRVIVHLAGVIGPVAQADPTLAEAVNVDGTAALLEAAHANGVERIVLASTAAVYGDNRRRPMTESDEPQPNGVYAWTKLQAERLLAAAPVATDALRIFNVYGPAMPDSLVTRLLRATPVSPVRLNGLDGFVRDYVHLDDVVAALLAAAASTSDGHRVLNVGTGVPMSNRALLDSLPARVRDSVELGPEVDSYSCADIAQIVRELGWHPAAKWPPTER